MTDKQYTDDEIMLDHEREFLDEVNSISCETLVYSMSPIDTLRLIKNLTEKVRDGYVQRAKYRDLLNESIKKSNDMCNNVLKEILSK